SAAAAARATAAAAPAPTAGIAATTTAALLLGVVLIHFDLMQRLVQLLAGLSEILQQLHLVIEVDNERLVFVFAQYVFKERVAGGALRVDNGALAAAGIHQQPEGQRQIGFAGEIADDLRPAVFLEDEVVLVEVGDNMAILIAHSREQIHHVDVRGEGGALLAGWSALLSDQQLRRRKQGQQGEETAPGNRDLHACLTMRPRHGRLHLPAYAPCR